MKDRKRAEQFCKMICMPQGEVRPSKKEVLSFLKSVNLLNEEEFSSWTKYKFECKNEGVTIFGEFFPVENAKGCVILVHGFAQNRYIMIPQQKIFRKMGFHTILFDQRAFGESDELYCTFGLEEAKDVACIVEWVKKKYGKNMPVILLGVSMGAATVMNALEQTEEIDYTIEDCGFTSFMECVDTLYTSFYKEKCSNTLKSVLMNRIKELGIHLEENTPLRSIQRIDKPICIIHGDSDSTIDVSHALHLYESSRNKDSCIQIFEGKEHALSIMDTEKYENVLHSFLKKIV